MSINKMKCKYCNSYSTEKSGNKNGLQRYKCLNCKKSFCQGEYVSPWAIHFKVRILKSDKNRLTRDNYCIPTKELDYKTQKIINQASNFIDINGHPPGLVPRAFWDIPNKTFEDTEHYTDEYVKKHYNDCMANFDLNMRYFENISEIEFNDYLLKFTRKHRFKEILDLNQLTKPGIYIMVLDKYKQVYIGIDHKNVKKRILRHWSSTKDFGHLIFGSVSTSVLSIDSFGAFDTTRIFFKSPRNDLDDYENEIVSTFKKEYILNRVGGGINSEVDIGMRNVMLLASMHKRNLG